MLKIKTMKEVASVVIICLAVFVFVLISCKKSEQVVLADPASEEKPNVANEQPNNPKMNSKDLVVTIDKKVKAIWVRFINEKILIPGGMYPLNPQIIVNRDGSALIPVDEGFLYTSNIYADNVEFEKYKLEYTVTDDMMKDLWLIAKDWYLFEGRQIVTDFEEFLKQRDYFWNEYITPALSYSFAKAGIYTVFYKAMFFTLDIAKSIDSNKKLVQLFPELTITNDNLKDLQDPDVYRMVQSYTDKALGTLADYENIKKDSKISIIYSLLDRNESYVSYGFDKLKVTKYGRLFAMGAHTVLDDGPETEGVFDYTISVSRLNSAKQHVIDYIWISPKMLSENNDVVKSIIAYRYQNSIDIRGLNTDIWAAIAFPLCAGDFYYPFIELKDGTFLTCYTPRNDRTWMYFNGTEFEDIGGPELIITQLPLTFYIKNEGEKLIMFRESDGALCMYDLEVVYDKR